MYSPQHNMQGFKQDKDSLNHLPITKRSLNVHRLTLPARSPLEIDEIHQKLSTLQASTTGREQTLSAQLKEITQNLKTLATQKRSELNASKLSKESYRCKIDSIQASIQQLNEEYQQERILLGNDRVESENEVVHGNQSRNKHEGLKMFTASVLKTKVDGKCRKLEDQEQRMRNLLGMSQEDFYVQKTELGKSVCMREIIEEKLKVFCEEFCDEIEYFEEEDVDYRRIYAVVEMKQKFFAEFSAAECEILRCEVGLMIWDVRLQMINHQIEEYITACEDFKSDLEVAKLEWIISQKCKDLKIPSLQAAVLQTSIAENSDLETAILRIQLNSIKAVKEQLISKLEYTESTFLDTSSLIKSEKDKIKSGFISSLNCKIKLISQCLLEFSVPSYSSSEVKIIDSEVIERFRESFKSSIDPESVKVLESLLSLYLSKVSLREKIIQEFSSVLTQKLLEKKKISERIEMLKEQRNEIKQASLISRRQAMVLLEKENSLKLGLIGNSVVNGFLQLKSNLFAYDNKVVTYAERAGILKDNLSIIQETLVETQKLLQKNKRILQKITEHCENFSAEALLAEYQSKINKFNAELLSVKKDFKNFENEFHLKLTLIEQEELILRSQQQSVESALKNIENESKKIKEMEYNLINDDIPSPSSVVYNENTHGRSRVKTLVPSIDLFSRDTREGSGLASEAEGNNYSEFPMRQLSKNLSTFSDRSLLQSRFVNKKYYRFNLEEITQSEAGFLERIRPLLEGAELYKKFEVKGFSKSPSFEVLDSLSTTPEYCGYAMRQFSLHKSLNNINVKQPYKAGFESVILTDYLMQPYISPSTIKLLRAQGYLFNNDLDYEKPEKMKDSVSVDLNSERFKEQYRKIEYYPFTISLLHGEKIELVAKGYQLLKQWINGLNALVKYKKYIPKLRSRIDCYTAA